MSSSQLELFDENVLTQNSVCDDSVVAIANVHVVPKQGSIFSSRKLAASERISLKSLSETPIRRHTRNEVISFPVFLFMIILTITAFSNECRRRNH